MSLLDKERRLKVIGWRVWYDNGSQYSSKEIKWCKLFDDGVISVVLYFDDKTRRIMDGSDWYFKAVGTDDYIYGQNNDTVEENKKRYGKDIILKRGKWTDEETMYKIQKEVTEAKDWLL